MKFVLILLSLCLLGCKGQSTKQEMISNSEIEIEERSLTKGEQDSLIMVLSPYLEVDTTFIKQCIVYVKQNQPKQLLDLFDKEKVNIYGHPSNTIAHEIDLHYMILSLYEKYYRPSNERLYAEKMAELYEMSLIHVIGLELFGGYSHPDFIPLAKVLVDCYSEGLNNYDRAIELQKQICERIEKEEPEGKASENYGYELAGLANLYLANEDTIRTDSCLLELRKNPYMEMLFQEQ